MKILVTNVYSYKNKGDAAIVISLIREIKSEFPGAEILIQTADVQNDVEKYGAPITSSLLWTLLSSVRDKFIVLRLWRLFSGVLGLTLFAAATRLIKASPYFVLSKDLRRFVEDNRSSDFAIACGGGYLRTSNAGFQNLILLYVTCLNFVFPKYLGKKVFLYSQSIGPVHGVLQTKVLRWALSKVDLIEPREDVSVKFLDSLKLKTPIKMTADPALLLGGLGQFPKDKIKLHGGRLQVGITVRKWFDNSEQLDAYLTAIAATIDYLIDELNAEVFYVPQVIAENFGDDDRIIANKVWEKVRHQDSFNVVDLDLHPYEVIGLCGAMDIFIGTRMHSNIFALISNVPVLAIEYEHKTRGIMRGLDLEEFTVDIQDVSFELLKEKVEKLLKTRELYKQKLSQNMPAQVQVSHSAIQLIRDYV